MSENLKVTSIEELKKKSGGRIVPLPGWKKGEVVNFKLRRPSLLKLSKEGKIPNSLLSAAEEVFTGTKQSGKNGPTMKEIGEVMNVLIRASLMEPTMEELEQNDIQLTDNQMTQIFTYTQEGVSQFQENDKEKGDTENN